MTESEAVEKLKNMRLFMQIEDENNDCKFTEDDYKANEMAIQTLEKQINGRWISVNDRLPEEFEDVLVALSGKIRGGTCDGEYRDDICVGYYGYNRWHNHTNLYDCKVNYWMPLPKPYKESEE